MHVINRFVVINLNLGGFEGSYPTSIAYFPEFVVLLKIKMHVGTVITFIISYSNYCTNGAVALTNIC